MKVVVSVKCKCGNLINIRAKGTRKTITCWNCNRPVGFEMRGHMRARGFYLENFQEFEAQATVIAQEEE